MVLFVLTAGIKIPSHLWLFGKLNLRTSKVDELTAVKKTLSWVTWPRMGRGPNCVQECAGGGSRTCRASRNLFGGLKNKCQ